MKVLNRKNTVVEGPHPIRILQFGGGNFLRGFLDWMIHVYNIQSAEPLGILIVVSELQQHYEKWQNQDGLYHVLTKGIQDGCILETTEMVTSVSRILSVKTDWLDFLESALDENIRFIFSNTTEAGIRFSEEEYKMDAPPIEFPAKLTIWLYKRYQFFQGSHESGCIVIPTELIDKNGSALLRCIVKYVRHWSFDAEFIVWLNSSCIFCNTLVDRIVPGISDEMKPKEWQEIGYVDAMITQGEPYHFLAIEAPDHVKRELPLDAVGLNVLYTDDIEPYKIRKVRILNGAHTAMVFLGTLSGLTTVRECVEHPILYAVLKKAIDKEIISSLKMDKKRLQEYASKVMDRFRNPYMHHELTSISLNSISKFKTRIIPSISEFYDKHETLPEILILSFAALVHYYKGEKFGSTIKLRDDEKYIGFIQSLWLAFYDQKISFTEMAIKVLSWKEAWDIDLSQYEGFSELLASYLKELEEDSMAIILNRMK